ncbi:peptidase family m41 domain-containing protein [Ditylenchus destructor]|uniref:Peptidase family m41 domain-containing protein n=1 Tax=Ditylenchus destructor TaxID=166010 RepID=A0AAD4RDX5_9BILA|nr:peptidase family m41 domain-containing protein [Ditylenchus destructor]
MRAGPDATSYTYTTYKTETEKLPEGQRNTFNEALIKGVLLSKESVGEGPKKEAWKTALRIVMWGIIIYVAITLFSGKNKMAGHIGNILMSSPEEVKPEDVTVGFDDVRGMDEAKCEVEEIVNYLKDPDRFSRLGGRLPKGVLMVGPPGTGKTLLARAIAGEAQVPFFHTSGSEFDELLVGQGARRVRDLFERAKQKAPCIIFIDEIDSVGAKRSSNSIHPYANQTINQLLSEMDGFNRNEGIIVIGATNRVEDLDKALLRPGRFDVRVTVMKPDLAGRKDIFNLYLDKITHDKNVVVDTLAKGSTGFTGADIENMVNQAALKAATEGCKRVYMRHLDEARDRILMGPARKQGRFPDEETNRNTAFHEAGHTLVAYFTKNATPLHKVTIIPRGPSMGHTAQLPDKDQYQVTRSQLMAQLDVLMGGRVAEELILGMENVTTGASDDLKRATQLAIEMVKRHGMSTTLGLRDYTVKDENNSLVSVNERSPQTNETIDQEIKKLLDESYARAKDLLTKYKKEHHALAEALLQYETLSADEIGLVIKGKEIPRDATQPIIGEAMGRKQKRGEKFSGLVAIQLERGKLEGKP